jgi:carbonic anhydrase
MPQEIKKLIDGNTQFREKFFTTDSTLFDALVLHGQKPKIMVVACSDSRVDPAVIFNSQPGELFVIRNIANLVPPCEDNDTSYHGTSAALEFGTCFLEISHIIILGHTQCGGIQTLLEATPTVLHKHPHSFIAKWMDLARPAYDKVITEHGQTPLQEQVTLCEQYALINSLHNLHSFAWIAERVNKGSLTVHAWYFDVATGNLNMYDQTKKHWITP